TWTTCSSVAGGSKPNAMHQLPRHTFAVPAIALLLARGPGRRPYIEASGQEPVVEPQELVGRHSPPIERQKRRASFPRRCSDECIVDRAARDAVARGEGEQAVVSLRRECDRR